MDVNSKIEPQSKKLKVDSNIDNIHDYLNNLSNFQLTEIINNNTTRKTICLKGKFDKNSDDFGLVLFEKTAFSDSDIKSDNYFSEKCSLEKEFSNDIYGNYKFFPKSEFNDLKTTVIYPATEKHVAKYKQQNLYLINETKEIYNEITLPYLEKEQLSLQWVYNILEGKSEADRVVFRDSDPETGFVLLPDLKWDGKKETLYLLAIVNKHGIKSIRDLTEEHIPLLKNVLDKSCETISNKYNLDQSQLRIYFHYQPSFYHLHIHFTYLKNDPPGIYCEKSHILSNVISNLEIFPEYYKKITLPFVIKESENLFKIFEEKKLLKKIVE